jgi:hypothetical protein
VAVWLPRRYHGHELLQTSAHSTITSTLLVLPLSTLHLCTLAHTCILVQPPTDEYLTSYCQVSSCKPSVVGMPFSYKILTPRRTRLDALSNTSIPDHVQNIRNIRWMSGGRRRIYVGDDTTTGASMWYPSIIPRPRTDRRYRYLVHKPTIQILLLTDVIPRY